MSDITVINDSEQSSLVTNGLAKNGELYLKAAGSTDAGAIVAYDSGSWRTFAHEPSGFANDYSVETDGVDDRLSAYSEAFNTGDFTISMWVKLSAINHRVDMFLLNQGSQFVNIKVRTGGFRFFLGGTSLIYNVGGTPSANTWYHLVWSHSGNTATPYINGAVASYVFQSNATVSVSGSQNVLISGGSTGGLYDEVALFDSALSSSDVASIYNSGTPGDISSLSPVNWWRMGDDDSGTGTTITDQGSGSNNLSLLNGATFSTTVPS
jgi:hypothetical protein